MISSLNSSFRVVLSSFIVSGVTLPSVRSSTARAIAISYLRPPTSEESAPIILADRAERTASSVLSTTYFTNACSSSSITTSVSSSSPVAVATNPSLRASEASAAISFKNTFASCNFFAVPSSTSAPVSPAAAFSDLYKSSSVFSISQSFTLIPLSSAILKKSPAVGSSIARSASSAFASAAYSSTV